MGVPPRPYKDRYKPNKNKRPEYLAARPRGGWLFGPEISARRTIVQSDPNHPDLPLRVSLIIWLGPPGFRVVGNLDRKILSTLSTKRRKNDREMLVRIL